MPSVNWRIAFLSAVMSLAGVWQSAPSAVGTIAGEVIDPQSHPIERAVLTFESGVGQRTGRTAIADETGHFSVSSLAAGRYYLTATHQGFAATRYATTAIDDRGVPIDVDPGDQVHLTVVMKQSAVITGTVFDENGDPLAGAFVSADGPLVPSMVDAQDGSAVTDRHGRYRLFGLPTGSYIVSLPSLWSEIHETVRGVDRVMRAVTVYWPGVVRRSEARAITIGEGGIADGVDFRMTRVPVAPLRVVVRSSNGQIGSGAAAVLESGGAEPPFEVLDKGERTFVVPAGAWIVRAAGNYPYDWAEVNVTTNGETPVEVNLTLAPTSALSGSVVVKDSDQKAANISIWARPADGRPRFSGLEPQARPNATGHFILRGLTPGRYWLSTSAGNGMIARLFLNGAEAPGPIQIRGRDTIENAEIRITRELSGVVEGTITNGDGQADLRNAVVLLTEDDRFWDAGCEWIRTAQSSTKGRVRFENLPAGRYRLAVTELRRPDCSDSNALRDLARNGISVELSKGETKQIALAAKR